MKIPGKKPQEPSCEIDLSKSYRKLTDFKQVVHQRVAQVLKVRKKFDSYLRYVQKIRQQQALRSSQRLETRGKDLRRDDILSLFKGKEETNSSFRQRQTRSRLESIQKDRFKLRLFQSLRVDFLTRHRQVTTFNCINLGRRR